MACSMINSVIHVETFYNPRLFWFVYDEDIANRNIFNGELNNSSVPYPRILAPENQSIIAVKYGNNFVRAKLVCANSLKRNYTCWLIDYGIFTDFVEIFELPQRFKFQPAFAKKAMLYGIKPHTKYYDWANGGFVETATDQWQDGVNREIKRILKQPKVTLSFVKKCEYNGFVIGDIVISAPNLKDMCITDMIAGLGLAELDDANFNIELFSDTQPDLSLRDVYMSIGQKGTRSSEMPSGRKSPIPLSGWLDLHDEITESSATEYVSCSSDIETSTKTQSLTSVGRGKLRKYLIDNSERISPIKAPEPCGVQATTSVSSAGRGYLKAKLNSLLNQRQSNIADEDMFQDAESPSPDTSGDSTKLSSATSPDTPYTKTAGRGFAKLFLKNKNAAPQIGHSPNLSATSSDDDQFQDARGRNYAQTHYKKTDIKAEPTSDKDLLPFAERNVKCDVLKFKPAGAQLSTTRKRITHERSSSKSGNSSDSSANYDSASSANSSRKYSPSGKNIRAGMVSKRVPTDYSSDDSATEANNQLNAPNCEVSKASPSANDNLVTGRCECTICKAWRSNVMLYKPHDLRERRPKQKKKIEKPPILFKTAEQQSDDMPGTIKLCDEFQNTMDKFNSPRILVHGYLIPKPIDSLEVLPLKSAVLKSMRRLNYVKSQRIQSYTWPAILRGNNVFIVSGPKSGKTMVYVPVLCHFLLTKSSFYGQQPGPVGIVLCPGSKTAWNVGKIMQKLLEGSQRSHVCVCISPVGNRKLTESIKNARVLICTPSTLISILKEKIVKLPQLSHIVLESAKELFERFPSELEMLFNVFQNLLIKRTSPIAIQMIVVSPEWSHAIENFAKRLFRTPLICIGSYLEAAFYGRADIKVQFLESAAKAKRVVDIVTGSCKVYKTLIVCNELDEIKETLKLLETHGIDFLTVDRDSTVEDINDVNLHWSAGVRGNYYVVVCTDEILATSLYFVDASIVIHYSLPSSWTQFAFRFSTCMDNYKSPFLNTNSPTCKVHIFVDESNSQQFVKMIQLLKRMGCNLSENILSLYEQYLNKLETTKINAGTELCKRMKMSGLCFTGANCPGRHMLSKDLDLTNRLPKSGIIKMKLLYVDVVNRLFGRVVEYIDAEHQVHAVEDNYAEIAAQLLKLTNPKEQKHVIDVQLGDLCVVRETDELYRRCKVLKITKHGTLNRALNVYVKLIDTGAEILTPISDLFLLPDHLKTIPPQAVEIFVANIGPADKDTTWSYYCTDRLLTELDKSGYQDTNCYFTGRIKLQLNNTIWVDNLLLKEFLENGTLPVIKMSVRGFLLKSRLAEERREHLLGLYDLCKKCGFNLPNYSLPVLNNTKPTVVQSKPVWAHLENCEEYNVVNLITVQSPDSFIIRLCKNETSFNRLTEDIQNEMNKPFFPTLCTAVEGQCYLAKDPEGDKYHRVLVTRITDEQAECLFVDFGDYSTVPVAELKFLSNELIEQLPFQIIECKLWGIKSKHPYWPTEAVDFFYEFTLDPVTHFFRLLQVKVIGHESPEITGYKKYSVVLINTLGTKSIVNKEIVDKGYALATDNLDVVDFGKLVNTEPTNEQSDSNDEHSNDENNNTDDSEWEFQSADPAKFFRHIFGIPDTPNIPVMPEKKQITCSAKPKESIALPAPGYSTPKVQWHQTDTHVTLKIQLPDVTVYEIHVLRKRLLSFKTEYNHTQYRLDLTLFAKVESDITHEALGMYIQVKLTKQTPAEWDRLVAGTERLRNITYNVAVLPNEYDSDDDQQLPREVFERAKARDDDNQEGYVYEIGSDVDYSDTESDVFSDRESSDS